MYIFYDVFVTESGLKAAGRQHIPRQTSFWNVIHYGTVALRKHVWSTPNRVSSFPVKTKHWSRICFGVKMKQTSYLYQQRPLVLETMNVCHGWTSLVFTRFQHRGNYFYCTKKQETEQQCLIRCLIINIQQCTQIEDLLLVTLLKHQLVLKWTVKTLFNISYIIKMRKSSCSVHLGNAYIKGNMLVSEWTCLIFPH